MKIAVVVPLGVTFFRTSYHFGVGLSYQTELMGFIPVPISLVIARPVEEISLRKCTTFSSPYSSQEEVAQTGQFLIWVYSPEVQVPKVVGTKKKIAGGEHILNENQSTGSASCIKELIVSNFLFSGMNA